MTKRDKVVMLSAVLLALCVMFSIVLFSVNSNKNTGSVNIESLIYVGATVLIGIFSVAIVYFTKVRKSKYERMLNASYFQEYEIIRDAIMNSQLSNISKKEIKDDILDMLLEGQKAGKLAIDVVENPVLFSQKIISAFSIPARFAILSMLDAIIAFVLFVIGVNTFLWLEQIDKSFFDIGIDMSMILFFIIIAFGLIPATKKLTSTKNPWMFMIPLGFGIAYVAVAEILRKYFYNIELVKVLLDGTLKMIPSIAVFMLYLLSIPVLMFFKGFLRKKTLKNKL